MKIIKILGLIICFVLLLVFIAGLYIKFKLPDVANSDDLTIAITPERLERGKYLANHVTVCIDCHSQRDWSIYSAPLVPGTEGIGGEVFNQEMGFPGFITAKNITPAALDTWSDADIYRAITVGVDKQGVALFPVMSYHRFGIMAKEDIYSIIAYLRSLPPLKGAAIPATKLDFPVNILVNLEPKQFDHMALPEKSDTINYGAYLINAAGCVDCHSTVSKGKIIKGTEYSGGMEFKLPNGILTAPNITMDKTTGIGLLSKDTFIHKFKLYADSAYQIPKVKPNEMNTPMPWKMYSGMSSYDLGAIYAYLKSLKPITNKIEVRKFN